MTLREKVLALAQEWGGDDLERDFLAVLDMVLEAAAQECDKVQAEYTERIAQGKGEWPKPGYVRDATWARWYGCESGASQCASAIRALKDELAHLSES